MTNPISMNGRNANRFNLNINPQFSNRQIQSQQPKVDLRDRYSVQASAQRMGFKNMDEYQNFMWESRMQKQQVQQAADQQAMDNTVSGIGAIVKGISDIISLF